MDTSLTKAGSGLTVVESELDQTAVIAVTEELEKQGRRLKAVWQSMADVRSAAKMRIGALEGCQQKLMRKMPAESPKRWAARAKFSPNVLGKVMQELTFLYNGEVLRPTDQEEQWRESFWDHVDGGLDGFFDEADPLVAITGVCLNWLHWTSRELVTGEVKAGVQCTLLTPDRFVALALEDPIRPHEVVALWDTRLELTAGHKRQKCDIMLYVNDRVVAWYKAPHNGGPWQLLENSDREPFYVHGLNRCPVVAMRNTVSRRAGSFYGPAVGGDDLLPNTRALAEIYTELQRSTKLARDQKWIAGEVKGSLHNSPEKYLKLQPGGNAGSIPSGAALGEMESVAQLMNEAYAISLGADPDVARLKSTLSESGKSLLVRKARMREWVKRRRRAGEQWERETHVVAAELVAYNTAGDTILDPYGVKTEYVEHEPILTVAERQSLAQWMLSEGLLDRRGAVRMVQSHMPEKEIDQMLQRAEEEMRERAQRQALVAGHAGDVEAQQPQPEAPVDPESEPVANTEDRMNT